MYEELSTAPSERTHPLLDDERMRHACWFYLWLATVTCAAKLAYLDQIYARNVGSVLTELQASLPGAASKLWLCALISARDAWQTFLVSGALFLLTAKLSARARSIVLRLFSLLYLIVLAANHISFVELGTFASKEALLTTWTWATQKPEVLQSHLTLTNGLSMLLLVSLSLAPELLSKSTRKLRVLSRALPFTALSVVLTASVLSPVASARFGERAFPVHGYWTSAIAAARSSALEDPRNLTPQTTAELTSQYQKLAYVSAPGAKTAAEPFLKADSLKPRHVLVVGLETAPKAYYPLTSSSDLPTFERMTQRAIVSDRHYTTSPYTRIANFSMLSGLYAPPSGLPVRFGPIASDGFAAVLRKHGYETTYIDSWVLDWLPGSGERDQAKMLGFDTVLDSAVRRDDGVFEVLLEAENVAFDRAFSRISGAHDRGRKAAVFVGTMLGHAPWPASEADQQLDSFARLHKINLVFDGMFERLLARLEDKGILEDVLILVVGDHGLRLTDEFKSVGATYSHSDLQYNVPFLLYAPGIVERTLRVPHATSHIDITPTLLQLVGVDPRGMLHHGAYVFDEHLQDRVLFLSASKLGPVDGLTWRGAYLTYHSLSGIASLGRGEDPGSFLPMRSAHGANALPQALRDPAALLDAFSAHTNLVAARMLERGASEVGRQVVRR